MAITAVGSAATCVTPLQITHGAISIHSAGEKSINQVMDHACKAVFVKSRFEYTRACICHRLLAGMYRYSQRLRHP